MTNSPVHYCSFRILVILSIFLVAGFNLAYSQDEKVRVVQISGKVVTEENNNLVMLPFAGVSVKGTSRGTLTDLTGFFSIVVRTDETLVFTMLGYKDAFFNIPDTLTRDRYTVFQIMAKDTFLLPTAVIYPWPDPDNFVQEFLAMDTHNELEDIAAENLSPQNLEMLREYLPRTGRRIPSSISSSNPLIIIMPARSAPRRSSTPSPGRNLSRPGSEVILSGKRSNSFITY